MTWVIGIAGGIASGKSLVAAQLRELGAEVLDADAAGHEVLKCPEVVEALVERWGPTILDLDRAVVRRRVAEIVFGDSAAAAEELAFLEELTHPRIGERLRERIENARQSGCPALVLDAPVMFKSGWNKMCDKVLFVDSPEPLRRQRAVQRGWSEAEFRDREAAQTALSVKRAASDVVIDNGETPEKTMEQVQRLWQEWKLDAN